MVKNGTINAGMSTKGNRVIGLVVTFPIGPLIPGKAPEDRVAIDTATTKSAIPRIFHITNRRLAANNGLRIKLSTIQGAVIPIAMSPSPAGRANSPGKIPFAYSERKPRPPHRQASIAAMNRRSAPRMKSRNGLDPKYAARNTAKGIATPKKIGSGGEFALPTNAP